MKHETTLPPAFAELEKFAAIWAKPSVDERIFVRGTNSMESITDFYDAAIVRAEEMLTYLDQFPLHDMPVDAANLLKLLLGLAQASVAVEIQGQPLPPKTTHPLGVHLVSGIAPFG